ncbi:hypothetical protein [Crucivirus-495]|nr:hypothetical protein [Crucivirus-495]
MSLFGRDFGELFLHLRALNRVLFWYGTKTPQSMDGHIATYWDKSLDLLQVIVDDIRKRGNEDDKWRMKVLNDPNELLDYLEKRVIKDVYHLDEEEDPDFDCTQSQDFDDVPVKKRAKK